MKSNQTANSVEFLFLEELSDEELATISGGSDPTLQLSTSIVGYSDTTVNNGQVSSNAGSGLGPVSTSAGLNGVSYESSTSDGSVPIKISVG